MIKKKSIIDQIEVIRDGSLQIRCADLIIEDGVEIAKTYHRHVLHPGDNIDSQDDRIIAVAKAVWTSKVIKEYEDFLREKK